MTGPDRYSPIAGPNATPRTGQPGKWRNPCGWQLPQTSTGIKAREVEKFLAKPVFNHAVYLVYGPDAGLVSERADILAKKTGVDLSDPFSLIRIGADEAAADTARLASEAHTIAMFGGKRLIRISGHTRRDLARAVQPVLDTPPADAIVIIEAGDLKKSSALRKQLEKNPQSLSIPCYQDDRSAINQLIDQEIIANGLKIDDETRRLLSSLLGADRMVSRAELTKLALYCQGRDQVGLEDVRAVVGDASKLVMDDVVDAAASGNLPGLQSGYPKAIAAGNAPDMILLATLRHFQMLQMARTRLEQKRQPAASIVKSPDLRIHFSRQRAVSTALASWPLKRLANAQKRLDTAMFDCRSNTAAATSVASIALLALAIEAGVLQKRR